MDSFVLLRDKNNQVDFSKIKVKLLTSDHQVKEQTEAAPTGYYYLPIYDQGRYLLTVEGPSGWHFSPNEIAVDITSKQQCLVDGKEEDINFTLSGFSIYGSVTSETECNENSGGLEGVVIELYNSVTNELVSTTNSKSEGNYQFTNVAPNKYKLIAKHSEWTLSKFETNVEVTWGNVIVPDNFIVTGYTIDGNVLSMGDPIRNVQFTLYSKSLKSLATCNTTTLLNNNNDENNKYGNAICVTYSNENGIYKFTNIPCGNYVIVPKYINSNVTNNNNIGSGSSSSTYDLTPSSINVTVKKESVHVKIPVQVMGFSLTGRVIDNKEGGCISNVEIYVNGIYKTNTDKDGYYKIEQLKTGTYTITGKANQIEITTLENIKITHTNNKLPDLFATKFQICGKVYITQLTNAITSSHSRKVILANQLGVQLETVNTDKEGAFCFSVAPDQYVLSVQLTASDIQNGLLVNPPTHKVTVTNKPITDILFTQAKVNVKGTIVCNDVPCDNSITIGLLNTVTNTQITTTINNDNNNNEKESTFEYKDVLPGTYKVSVLNKLNYCWLNNDVIVEVKTQDINNIKIIQNGYKLPIFTTHAINVIIKNNNNNNNNKEKERQVQIQKGNNNNVCVIEKGTYTITPISCYKFDKDSYQFNTEQSNKIELNAIQFQVEGTIVANFVDKKQEEETKITVEINNQVVQVEKDNYNNKIYKYKYWSKEGEVMIIKPKSNILLFTPEIQTITNKEMECKVVNEFVGKPGLFIKGKVVPTIENVTIQVLLDNKIIIETNTDKNGFYSVGPLHDNLNYKINGIKDGYNIVIDNNNKNNFNAYKLARIQVEIIDGNTNTGVGGVLLSLSGTGGYRSNNVSLQNGLFTFSNLNPGSYYLKPNLKEYIFEPTTQTIEVIEGKDHKVQYKATRIAYSCFGIVNSLNGIPEKTVTIEAIGTNGEYEHTQTDNNGLFRIRGLLPNHSYKLFVKSNDEISRASPSQINITIANQDIIGTHFIAFRKSNNYDINGLVNTSIKDHINTLTVYLYRIVSDTNSLDIVNSVSLGPSNYFEFTNLEKDNYLIKVKSTLNNKLYKYEEPETKVTIQDNNVNVKIQFETTQHLESQELSSAPIFAILIGVTIIIFTFYFNEAVDLIKDIKSGNLFNKKKTYSSDSDSNVNDWLPSSLTQKKNKPKGKLR